MAFSFAATAAVLSSVIILFSWDKHNSTYEIALGSMQVNPLTSHISFSKDIRVFNLDDKVYNFATIHDCVNVVLGKGQFVVKSFRRMSRLPPNNITGLSHCDTWVIRGARGYDSARTVPNDFGGTIPIILNFASKLDVVTGIEWRNLFDLNPEVSSLRKLQAEPSGIGADPCRFGEASIEKGERQSEKHYEECGNRAHILSVSMNDSADLTDTEAYDRGVFCLILSTVIIGFCIIYWRLINGGWR